MGHLRVLEARSMEASAPGVWVPLLNPPYKLAEAAATHTAVQNRGTVGKVVLIP